MNSGTYLCPSPDPVVIDLVCLVFLVCTGDPKTSLNAFKARTLTIDTSPQARLGVVLKLNIVFSIIPLQFPIIAWYYLLDHCAFIK